MNNSRLRNRKRRKRVLTTEQLERREMLVSDFSNVLNAIDVSEDGFVSPIDALLGINDINAHGSRALKIGEENSPKAKIDVNADSFISPIDVLLVINALNAGQVPPYQLTETASKVSNSLALRIGSGQEVGTRTYRIAIGAHFDSSDQNAALEDTLAVYLVNPTDMSTVIDRGTLGTAVFTLSGNEADYLPGQVRFDGSVLEIDLTSAETYDQLLLVAQLINTDSDEGSTVTVTPLSNEADIAGLPPSIVQSLDVLANAGPTTAAILQSNPDVQTRFKNIRFDESSQTLSTEVSLYNLGEAVSRETVLVISVDENRMRSPYSGTLPDGRPYINFRDAILSGGLDSYARSQSIVLEIASEAGALNFSTEVWSTGPNLSPVLEPLSPVTVVPGKPVTLQLAATDAEGDSITYSSMIADATMAYSLKAGGEVVLHPTPSNLGQHTLTFIASDGMSTSTQELVVDVVADPIQLTRISGTVLDVDGSPLVGVPIEVGRFQATTQADGSFSVEIPSFDVPTESFDISVPTGDPYFDPLGLGDRVIELNRAGYDITTGTDETGPRQHPNLVSTFLDASVVYGSNEQRALALRTLDGTGRLKLSAGDLLPINDVQTFPDGMLENENNARHAPDELFAAGDVRANENPGLTALHTLLAREHNRRADEIKLANPGLDDEAIYQEARRWVIAVMQHITYNEFLPLLLGQDVLTAYSGYEPSVDPSISSLFSGAAFRFGHSIATSEMILLGDDGLPLSSSPLSTRDAFFNPEPVKNLGIDPILRGMAGQVVEALDASVIDDLRNFLFGPPGAGGLDLVSLNIQRGRDLGLPSYNAVRREFGLAPAADFAAISSDANVQARLASIYADVEQVDLWVGGLAEDHAAGAMIGSTFTAIIADQFERLRDGDRFWYENSQFETADLDAIRGTTISSLIERNTSITGLSANGFTQATQPAGPAAAGDVGSPAGYRSVDGTGNNASDSSLGSVGTNLLLNFTPAYGDGISTPAGSDRPGAREISNAVFAQSGTTSNAVSATQLFALWGQLLTHDTNLTPGGTDDAIRVRGDLLVGDDHYPFVAEKLPLMLEHEVYVGFDNAIMRPIYLPKLNMADAVTIDPMTDMVAQIPLAGHEMAEISITAGNLRDRQGNLFTGELSITEVPANLTPAALPATLDPSLVVTIQPAEMVFETPAPLTLPNREGLAPGTKLDLWSIDPTTGEFEVVGMGQVTEDGERIETIEGGIRTSSWHAFALILKVLESWWESKPCPKCEESAPTKSRANLFTGAVTDRIPAATYFSGGVQQGITLAYSSLQSDLRGAMNFEVQMECVLVGGAQRSQKLLAIANALFADGRRMALGGSKWAMPTCSGGGTVSFSGVLMADFSNLPTGEYEVELTAKLVTNGESGNEGAGLTNVFTIPILNSISSPYGRGWGIAGAQRIVLGVGGSILLIDGDGTITKFRKPEVEGQPYRSPPGDFSIMEKLADGTFRRTLKDQTVYQFNTANFLATVRDRNGNITTYSYETGLVASVTDFVGLTTNFEYGSNRYLSAVVDPYARRTEIETDSIGRVTRITAPDGSSQSWTYDSYGHTTSHTDANGNTGYDHFERSSGRAVGVTFSDGSSSQFQTYVGTRRGAALDRPDVELPYIAEKKEVTYVDPRGNVMTYIMDSLGQATEVSDSIGRIFRNVRNDNNLITDTIDGRGNRISFKYDDVGNITQISDAITGDAVDSAIRWIGGDGNWHDPSNWSTGVVPGPEDEVVIESGPANPTITISDASVSLKSLNSGERIKIAATRTLSVTGTAELSSDVILEGVLVADGPEADLTVMRFIGATTGRLIAQNNARITYLDSSELSTTVESYDGSSIEFPNLVALTDSQVRLDRGDMSAPSLASIDGTSIWVSGEGVNFTLPASTKTYNSQATQSADHRFFEATNGAVLDLSSLEILTNPHAGLWVNLNASSGGQVLLPNVAALLDFDATVYSSGANSFVDLRSLTQWRSSGGSPSFGRVSFLRHDDQGGINVDSLTATENIYIRAFDSQGMRLNALQRIEFGSLEVGARSLNLPNLTDIPYANLQVHEGGSVSTPNLAGISGASIQVYGAGTSYTLPSAITDYDAGEIADHRYFEAHDGAVLDLSSLNAMTNSHAGFWVNLNAFGGGQVLLPNVVALLDFDATVFSSGANSFVDLSNLTQWRSSDGSPSFGRVSYLRHDNQGSVNVDSLTATENIYIRAYDSDDMSLDDLQTITFGGLEVGARSLNLPSLTGIPYATLQVNEGGSVITPNLIGFDGASIQVHGTGTSYSLPSAITSYDAGEIADHRYFEAHDGAVLDLSSLTRMTNPHAGLWANFQAFGGGQVLLPNVTNLLDFDATFYSSGSNSFIDLSNLSQWRSSGGSPSFGRVSYLQHDDQGSVNVDSLQATENIYIRAFDSEGMQLDALQSVAFGSVEVGARSLNLPNLTAIPYATLQIHDGGAVGTPSLADVDGASIRVYGSGTNYTLPSSITSYDAGELADHRYFEAHDGAVLDLSAFASMTNAHSGHYVHLKAMEGGQVLLPNISALDQFLGSIEVSGTDSLIDLSSLQNWTTQGANSTLRKREGASIDIGSMTSLDGVHGLFETPDGVQLGQIENWDNGAIEFSGGTFVLTNLLDANDTHLYIDGARVEAPILNNIGAGTITLSNNGVLVAPNLPGWGGSGEGDGGTGGNSGAAGGNGGSGDGGGNEGGGNDGDGESPPAGTVSPITLAYDEVFAQLVRETDELGRETLHTIDPLNGNRLQTRRVVGQNDLTSGESDDQVVSYSYTDLGLVDLMTDPLGRVTDWDYDTFGRVVKVTMAKGTGEEAVYQLEYNAFGNVSAEIDPNGNRTEFEYDLLDRVTLVRDALGNETRYGYDGEGNLNRVVDARGNEWLHTYDEEYRLISTRDPQGKVTSLGYNDGGDLIRITDPLGHTTRYEYDVRGRRIQAIDPDGGITSFEYDLDNNLIALTDPVGNRTEFTYDARSRQTSEIDPLGNVIAYEYDAVDNLTRKTDRLGRVTLYEYDTLDRLTSETWLGGANLMQYQYDLADNLLSIQDSFSHLSYQYDALDRVTQVDNAGTPDTPQVVLDYAYDAAGNVLSVTDSIEGTPNGQTGYAYDALHRLQKLTQTAAPGAMATASAFVPSDKRVDFAYNQLSQYTVIRRYNDLTGTDLAVQTAYAYDSLNRLTSIDHTDAAANDLSFFHYQYDSSSRITQITDVSGTIQYAYDDRDQLTGALYSDPSREDESYSYDANGNRLDSHLHGDGYQTGAANRLLSDGTYDYEYDAEGNMVLRSEIATGAIREFAWDHRNRLVSVTDRDAEGTATQVVRFVYDAFDRRIAKHVDQSPGDGQDGTTLHFVYDREDVILDFLDPDGSGPEPPSVDQRYLHGAAVDEVLAQESSVEAAWLLADHLGSIRAAVTTDEELSTFTFDQYGSRSIDGPTDTRYAFTGRELDDEVSLNFYRARYYDTATGQFTNEDPLGFGGEDSNPRRYVGNGPNQRIDPFGLLFWGVVNAGEKYGEHAAQYWANKYVETGNPLYQVPGLFASLWTTCTSDSTALTLLPVGSILKLLGRGAKGASGAVRLAARVPKPTIVAQNGTKVVGYTKHGINRAAGDGLGRAGTSPKAIIDALKNPRSIKTGVDMHGRPFQIFNGANGRVIVNPQTGKIISVNPLGGGGVRGL